MNTSGGTGYLPTCLARRPLSGKKRVDVLTFWFGSVGLGWFGFRFGEFSETVRVCQGGSWIMGHVAPVKVKETTDHG